MWKTFFFQKITGLKFWINSQDYLRNVYITLRNFSSNIRKDMKDNSNILIN